MMDGNALNLCAKKTSVKTKTNVKTKINAPLMSVELMVFVFLTISQDAVAKKRRRNVKITKTVAVTSARKRNASKDEIY